jgi:hypothetical protein
MWQTVQQLGSCRRGLGGMLNDKTTKGYEISSHRGDCFNNLGARTINSLGKMVSFPKIFYGSDKKLP